MRGFLAKQIASTGDVDTTLSAGGRGVRVRFDGIRFWLVWIDDANAGALQIGRLDLDGTLALARLEGRVPMGDEAYELVINNG